MTAGIFQLIKMSHAIAHFIANPLDDYLDFSYVDINNRNAGAKIKTYAYNERVDVETIKQEIRMQAQNFNLDETFMINLADCESQFNNLATNNISSATGVYQFTWDTWKTTDSWKIYHKARTDYKINIKEAMISMSAGYRSYWEECL